MEPVWSRVVRETGLTLDHRQSELLDRYAHWLVEEAVGAGGIGPEEGARVETRHLADSLLFLHVLPSDTPEIWDLGSGVGLPGIPLAIALPLTRLRLIDRSGRRAALARRAIRVLGLENCEVIETDITSLRREVTTAVTRATLPPDLMYPVMERVLRPGGLGVMAGSWHTPPRVEGWELREIVSQSLDRTVWLLIMRRQ